MAKWHKFFNESVNMNEVLSLKLSIPKKSRKLTQISFVSFFLLLLFLKKFGIWKRFFEFMSPFELTQFWEYFFAKEVWRIVCSQFFKESVSEIKYLCKELLWIVGESLADLNRCNFGEFEGLINHKSSKKFQGIRK